MPASPELQFGVIEIASTSIPTTKELELVISENGSETDNVSLHMHLGHCGGLLDVRTDDAARLIYDLYGDGPLELEDGDDGDLLRWNLYNGFVGKPWLKVAGWENASLIWEIRFYLTNPTPDVGVEESTVGNIGGIAPYMVVKKTEANIPSMTSVVEAFVHPTVREDPNPVLDGISIDNFKAKRNNLVYVELLVYLNKDGIRNFDAFEDGILEHRPPITLGVKLDKDK